LRLAALLAQYLYQQKRLDLPGLGTFIMEQTMTEEVETSRHGRTVQTEQIRFEHDPSVKESPALITFISAQTGKIKALASADLDSHLEIIQQFLNIGKPFSFEGIGNLVKVRAGEYQFSPGPLIPELKKEAAPKETAIPAEEVPEDYNYKNIFYPKQVKAGWKKPMAVFLLVAGLVLAIWGGYVVYKRTMAKKEKQEKNEPTAPVEIAARDTSVTVQKDTLATPVNNSVTPAGNYKFILENSTAPRALTRYNKLRSYQWNVQLETKDSVNYKIYMVLPVTAADTTKVLDSLSMLTGKKVYIE
jgi:hypothetical protein